VVAGPITLVAIYIIIWWVVLFTILPLGMNQGAQERPTDGSDWGAPPAPNTSCRS
jgi:predicted secreted protein